MRTMRVLVLVLFFCGATPCSPSRAVNQHTLLQVETTIALPNATCKDTIPPSSAVQWILRVEELLLDNTASSTLVDEQTLSVTWDTAVAAAICSLPLTGNAAYSLLLPVHHEATAGRRQQRTLRIAIWEQSLSSSGEITEERFGGQQIAHLPAVRTIVPQTSPEDNDNDKPWNPHVFVPIRITSPWVPYRPWWTWWWKCVILGLQMCSFTILILFLIAWKRHTDRKRQRRKQRQGLSRQQEQLLPNESEEEEEEEEEAFHRPPSMERRSVNPYIATGASFVEAMERLNQQYPPSPTSAYYALRRQQQFLQQQELNWLSTTQDGRLAARGSSPGGYDSSSGSTRSSSAEMPNAQEEYNRILSSGGGMMWHPAAGESMMRRYHHDPYAASIHFAPPAPAVGYPQQKRHSMPGVVGNGRINGSIDSTTQHAAASSTAPCEAVLRREDICQRDAAEIRQASLEPAATAEPVVQQLTPKCQEEHRLQGGNSIEMTAQSAQSQEQNESEPVTDLLRAPATQVELLDTAQLSTNNNHKEAFIENESELQHESESVGRDSAPDETSSPSFQSGAPPRPVVHSEQQGAYETFDWSTSQQEQHVNEAEGSEGVLLASPFVVKDATTKEKDVVSLAHYGPNEEARDMDLEETPHSSGHRVAYEVEPQTTIDTLTPATDGDCQGNYTKDETGHQIATAESRQTIADLATRNETFMGSDSPLRVDHSSGKSETEVVASRLPTRPSVAENLEEDPLAGREMVLHDDAPRDRAVEQPVASVHATVEDKSATSSPRGCASGSVHAVNTETIAHQGDKDCLVPASASQQAPPCENKRLSPPIESHSTSSMVEINENLEGHGRRGQELQISNGGDGNIKRDAVEPGENDVSQLCGKRDRQISGDSAQTQDALTYECPPKRQRTESTSQCGMENDFVLSSGMDEKKESQKVCQSWPLAQTKMSSFCITKIGPCELDDSKSSSGAAIPCVGVGNHSEAVASNSANETTVVDGGLMTSPYISSLEPDSESSEDEMGDTVNKVSSDELVRSIKSRLEECRGADGLFPTNLNQSPLFTLARVGSASNHLAERPQGSDSVINQDPIHASGLSSTAKGSVPKSVFAHIGCCSSVLKQLHADGPVSPLAVSTLASTGRKSQMGGGEGKRSDNGILPDFVPSVSLLHASRKWKDDAWEFTGEGTNSSPFELDSFDDPSARRVAARTRKQSKRVSTTPTFRQSGQRRTATRLSRNAEERPKKVTPAMPLTSKTSKFRASCRTSREGSRFTKGTEKVKGTRRPAILTATPENSKPQNDPESDEHFERLATSKLTPAIAGKPERARGGAAKGTKPPLSPAQTNVLAAGATENSAVSNTLSFPALRSEKDKDRASKPPLVSKKQMVQGDPFLFPGSAGRKKREQTDGDPFSFNDSPLDGSHVFQYTKRSRTAERSRR